ncbi:unnamed protein product [Rotaria sp. Silwood1]|nr:unnamed protein product [Rotaria sp. Silwood1]
MINSNDSHTDSIQSFDDEQNSSITDQVISTVLLTSIQEPTPCSSLAEDLQSSNNAEQSNINQLIDDCNRNEFVHHDELNHINHHAIEPGHSNPCNLNSLYHISFGSSQNHLQAEHNDHPTDELTPSIICGKFSKTITEYLQPPRESMASLDSQPHDMNILNALNNNNNNQNYIIDNEHNRPNVDLITQNNLHEIATSFISTGSHMQDIMTGNSIIQPTEIPQDTEFSVSTSEPQTKNETFTKNEKQNLLLDGLANIQDGVQLIHTGGQIDEASSINEISTNIVRSCTLSNQTNHIDEQPVVTQSTSNIPPCVTNPTDVTSQAILPYTDIPVLYVPKLPTALDTNAESGEQTDT